jgi:hypothetical protein
MAGVPHTVATWWEIRDAEGVDLAVWFDDSLKRDRGIARVVLDVARSTRSLREALLKSRATGLSPVVWAPYSHFGA